MCSGSVCEANVREADEALVPVDSYHPPLTVCVPVQRRSARTRTDGVRQDACPTNTSSGVELPQWNFAKANYELLYSSLIAYNWGPLYEMHDVEEIMDHFYNNLYKIIDCCVPKKTNKATQVDTRYRYPEWYSRDIIRAIKNKAELHKQYKKTGNSCDYEMFAQRRSSIKKMIVRAHEQHQDRVQNQFKKDPKSFWDYVRTRKGTGCNKSILKNGRILSESECADEFARYFYSVYNNQEARLDVDAAVAASGVSSARVHIDQVTLKQVYDALDRLKPKRSAGPDGIPAFIVRDCRAVLAKPLSHLFNRCLAASYFPERWKTTRVVPVPKSGGGSDVSGYRPVAVLSASAKVFESMIHKSVFDQVSNLLSDAQHGFRPERSTTSNLLNFMSEVTHHVDAGVQVDAAYFDFKKAFDLVDNDILLSKLAAVGCTPKLLSFFADYLRDRRQFVDYAGFKSEPYFTRSGVSQGTNLGPLQFIIMINDLPDVVRDATCLLFADDLKLLMPIHTEADCLKLQRDVDRVVEWSRKNKLLFNEQKCSVITFGRMRDPIRHGYELNDSVLDRKDNVRDLGVRLDTELTFREHITLVCKKSYRSLGFILRRAVGFKNVKAIAALYNALVRTQLEFNAAVWAPHETKYALMLERIQNKFTRYLYLKLYGVYPFYPLMYPTLFVLGMVGYNKLETRRDSALVTYIFKVLRGKISNPGVLKNVCLNVPDNYVARRRKPRLLAVPRGRTNLLGKAPLTRALHTLNEIAERLDLFNCSLNEFSKITLFVISCNG